MARVHFIVNPMSGAKDKRALMKVLEGQLRHSFDVSYTERPGHATELAKASDAEIVVAVGGDGTVNEVARGLIGTNKALGIVPSGSGNGLAYHLGIGRKPEQILKTLNDGIITYMDCGMLDGKPFFCTRAWAWMPMSPGVSPPLPAADCAITSASPSSCGGISIRRLTR